MSVRIARWMKCRCRNEIWFAVLLVAALSGSALAQHKLDHFKVYPVDPQPVDETVEVMGQFDKEPFKIRVRAFRYFANPVIKNKENDGRYIDENAHLKWYIIRRLEDPPTRSVTVEITNQFHEKPVRVVLARPPIFLLAPAEKKGHKFPEGLDHYLVYRVLSGEFEPRSVDLRDQWTEKEAEKTPLRRLVFVCVPCMKIHDGKKYEIRNERDHLTVYSTGVMAKPREAAARDQFGEGEFKITETANLLCVPSYKKVIDEPPPETMRPSVPTRCPPVETVCPAVRTKCPPVPTACSKGETTCPAVETKCPSLRTKCPAAETRCPLVSTTCPPIKTKCPVVLTTCPPHPTACVKTETACPPVPTKCPSVFTKCPPKKTTCPPVATVCLKGETRCPALATTCPPSLTKCPTHRTICPIAITACRGGVTICPAGKTKCPPMPTLCPPMATTCPIVFTTCTKGKTACPTVLTTCPPTITKCALGETFCPATETRCLGAITHCPITFDCLDIQIPDWKWKWPQLEREIPQELLPDGGVPTLPVEPGKADTGSNRSAAISIADLPTRGTRLPPPRGQ